MKIVWMGKMMMKMMRMKIVRMMMTRKRSGKRTIRMKKRRTTMDTRISIGNNRDVQKKENINPNYNYKQTSLLSSFSV